LTGEEQHPQLPNRCMQEIAQWISMQRDGRNYWEVLKVNLARKYSEFHDWLKEKNR